MSTILGHVTLGVQVPPAAPEPSVSVGSPAETCTVMGR